MDVPTVDELLKHVDHKLRVFESYYHEKLVKVGIECITCRKPIKDWVGAYMPYNIIVMDSGV